MNRTTIYRARRIHTMDPFRPTATHVAVRAGKVLGVGTIEELAGWGAHELDDRFADRVLLPGLIEGHSHMMAGSIWQYAYCGAHDTVDPDGRPARGLGSVTAVIERLRGLAGAAATGAAVTGWGLDPLHLGVERITRAELDAAGTAHPIGVLHASGHMLYANSAALQAAGLLRSGVVHPGIPLGADGLPTGELKGPEAMTPMLGRLGLDRAFLGGSEFGIRALGRLAIRAGVTTATDLGANSGDREIATLRRLTDEDDFPLRVVSALRTFGVPPKRAIERAIALRGQSTERMRLGMVKIVADGSIQAFSARLRWPGYFNGAPNGLWYVAPESVREMFELALRQGVQVHVHTNGDEAIDMVLDAMEEALRACYAPDHRFTLQHCQMADAAQFRRMRSLGMCVNLFANHVFFWGEAHRAITMGPDRAERINACRTARDAGVSFAVHSDAPITPMAPLFSAWCAVNRRTQSGRVLGPRERIDVADALHAITLGAARTLRLDHEIGSIECGKRADFSVLEEDPFEVPAERLKDVPVWGTVLGGRPFRAAGISG